MSSPHSKATAVHPSPPLRDHEHVPDGHRFYIRRERLIAVVINLVLSLAFTALLFSNVQHVPLWGVGGIAFDLVPTVFMLTLMGNLAMTVTTRRRLRDGAIAPMPARLCGWVACALPRNGVLRVALVASVVTVAVVPVSVLVLWLSGLDSMSYQQYLGFKALYGPAVGALSTGIIIKAALKGPGAA
ncbi:hypothetical protein [Massilia sp. CT11-137]|uniref:hypothetical protein n=1 Tax=Massilia sp. CT11-137 TaxID=3393901 RepID=UPI0039AF5821